MNRLSIRVALFVLLGGLCVVARLVDHAPNFTPMIAVALLGGVLFRSALAAAALPLAALVVSDAALGAYHPGVMATVYAAFLLPIAARRLLRRRLSALRIGACAVSASLVFFATTNFAHWLFMGMYPMTPAGLLGSYAAGLPFLKYQLAGDLFWSGLLFGAFAAYQHSISARRLAPVLVGRSPGY